MAFWSTLFHKKGKTRPIKSPEEVFNSEMEEELPEDEENDPDFKLYSEDKAEAPLEATDSDEEYEVVEREIHPAKIICPDCGGITLEGLEFCDKCGGELQ